MAATSLAGCRAAGAPVETTALTEPAERTALAASAGASPLPVESTAAISAEALARYYAVEPLVRAAYRRAFVQGVGGERRLDLLAPILSKAPDHPMAASYMASTLFGEGRAEEALAYLLAATSRKDLRRCRDEHASDLWLRLRAAGCRATGVEDPAGADAVWVCPPGLPGTAAWRIAVEAVDYNIVSVALAIDSASGECAGVER